MEFFFLESKKALNNLTSTYDIVWPITAGLQYLRHDIDKKIQEHPEKNKEQIFQQLREEINIHGVNYNRAIYEYTWEDYTTNIAWILLTNTITIFEEWLKDLNLIWKSLDIDDFQFPIKVLKAIKKLNAPTVMDKCFYNVYISKKNRNVNNIKNMLYCYRLFKEARNCYMHNGALANKRLCEAYKNHITYNNKSTLKVSEMPIFNKPDENKKIDISLRGVVGFSYILIKIIASIDTELIRTKEAEDIFISRYKSTHKIKKTIKQDENKGNAQLASLIRQCGFLTPQNIKEIKTLLIQHNLIHV